LLDSCVTDPPYGIAFMGRTWDNGQRAFAADFWREVFRVLKPGAHLVAFGGTRSYHRLASAIEDAGFEIRDQLAWVYGTGFPKSLDVSKAIDKAAGAAPEISGPRRCADGRARLAERQPSRAAKWGGLTAHGGVDIVPATPAALTWSGWGTALKPSYEPLCLARKPLVFWGEYAIIGSYLESLEAQLWSIVPANFAGRFSASSHLGLRKAMFGFVQSDAEAQRSTQAALSGLMDMSQFESALISSLNTVSSWNESWAEGSAPASTSITETELSTTINLITLKSSLSKITPESIILAHRSGRWSTANASNAESIFNASALRLRSILELSALAPAIAREADSSLDAGARPLWEPICLARKPLSERTVAANVLRWGTGAINIDACRIAGEAPSVKRRIAAAKSGKCGRLGNSKNHEEGRFDVNANRAEVLRCYLSGKESDAIGRWPANLCHDGSPEVVEAFPSPHGAGAAGYAKDREGYESSSYEITGGSVFRIGDSGSAARFFYSAKASKTDRCDSKHPTVKPVALMRWLCRLVTPPGGLILDPFAGTGTTAEAAIRESFRAILIEREPDYCLDIARRMSRLRKSPPPRVPAARKMRGGAWSGRSTETLPGTHHRANRA